MDPYFESQYRRCANGTFLGFVILILASVGGCLVGYVLGGL